ncbi:SpoIIE family protein phosphatase [Yinghuangia sp. YIM S09857]|uniref:SpoIIE family protein phosphatase n=1 Tax=Yinghuangia sp. YIM S09857 TaxID=3436929 RepID=UPI003F53B929
MARPTPPPNRPGPRGAGGGDGAAPASEDPPGEGGGADALRWAVLAETDDLSEAEVLRLAAQQATSAIGAAVGLVHLRGAEPGTLRLAAVAGLPARMARSWELLRHAPAEPYGVALERRRAAWHDTLPAAVAADPQWERWARTGMLSVPVEVHNVPVGVLSVLASRRPAPDCEAFLLRLASLVGRLLRNARRWHSGTAPWWQEPLTERREVMKQVAVGTWSWNLATGLLDIDGATHHMLEAAGLDPDSWDRRIETWMTRIHPDDRPGVQEAIDQSMRTGETYAVEYRVLGGGDRISWLELRGTFEYDETGAPVRMVGTAWDVTARRDKLDWLVGVLELHPDPIHVIDAADRVQWANKTARDMAGDRSADLVGAPLWDTVEELRDQGLKELFARARATPGAPMTAEVEARPSRPRRLHPDRGGQSAFLVVRAVQIGGLVTVQWADITDARRAERETAERLRRVMELNAALVRALDTDDVVGVVTSHLLPMFGAQGFLLHDLTGSRPRLIASSGYPASFVAELRERAGGAGQGGHELIATDAARWLPSAAEAGGPFADELRELAQATGKQAWAVLPLRVAGRLVGSCAVAWSRSHPFSADDEAVTANLATLIAQALENARLYEQARNQAERLQQELLPGELPTAFGVHTAARYQTAPGHEFGGDWYDVVPLPGGRVLAVIGDVMGHGLEQAITMGIIRHAVLAIAALDTPVDELMARLNDVVARLSSDADGQLVYATSLFAVHDATTGLCRIASAGHPPPVVLRPDAAPVSLEVPAGPPLGLAQVPAEVVEMTLEPDSVLVFYTNGLLGAGGADAAGLEDRIARYRDAAGAFGAVADRSAWLESLCDALSEERGGNRPGERARESSMEGSEESPEEGSGETSGNQPGKGSADRSANASPDDAALLVLGTEPFAAGRTAAWDLPWSPESAGRARELTSSVLKSWGLEELADAATLVVSELVGNTVRHAVGLGAETEPGPGVEAGAAAAADGPGVIRLRLLNLSEAAPGRHDDAAGPVPAATVVCEVYDGSEATPRVRHPSLDDEFGRGLQLVAMMADQWGARFTESGKCIWAALRTSPATPGLSPL